jgi:two-component system sensor histidine kinase BarA
VRKFLQHILYFTIARKITVVVMASVVVAVTSATGFYIYRQTSQNIAARHDGLTATAQVFAASVAPHLRARDKAAALSSLRAIGNLKTIPFVAASLNDGQVFAALGNAVIVQQGTGLDTITMSQDTTEILAMIWSPTLSVSVPAIQGGERVGSVSLLADISDLRAQFFEGIVAAIVAAFFASLLGLAVSSRLKRSVTSPLANLMGVISQVRDEHDYSVRAQRLSDDETGNLVDAFNTMLDQINARDTALARHRADLELTVEQRTAQLRVAKDAAETASEAKSTFLATMSHEIRTPMNGIMVMAELLAAAKLPPGQQRYADVIVNSGQSLLTIINDLLDLSKIEAGKLELEQVSVSPRAIIDNVLALFWERARSANLQMASFADPNVPDFYTSDPVRLTQILTNLANNAIKFTEQGHVGLAVRMVQNKGAGADMIEFSIIDTGIGIPQDKVASIFEEFSQADASTTRRFGGTGLGLSICKKLVTAMGGTIKVASRLGEGSRFVVTVPCKNPQGAERPDLTKCPLAPALVCLEEAAIANAITGQLKAFGLSVTTVSPADLTSDRLTGTRVLFTSATIAHNLIDSSAAAMPPLVVTQPIGDNRAQSMLAAGIAANILPLPLSQADLATLAMAMQSGSLTTTTELDVGARSGSSSGSFAGVKVLVADDNAVNREVVAEVLRQLEVEFDLVEDGAQAVAKWRTSDHNLILMDCSMPVMDGLEATKRIRNEEEGTKRARIPIVALTAHLEGDDNVNSWRNAGMDMRITKPFTVAQIADAIEQLTSASRQAAAPEATSIKTDGAGKETSATVPVLDSAVLTGLMEIGNGDPAFVVKMFNLFKDNAQPALHRIETASAENDRMQLADAAHALKSMAANLGAVRLVAACARVEAQARGNNELNMASELRLISAELKDVNAALEQHIRTA